MMLKLFMHLVSLFISVTDEGLSRAAALAIAAVVCLLVAFIAGTVCGVLLSVCISRWNKKKSNSNPTSNIQEPQQAVPVYDEVVPLQSQKIELKENMAYETANLP